jgi:hypothetical protein
VAYGRFGWQTQSTLEKSRPTGAAFYCPPADIIARGIA